MKSELLLITGISHFWSAQYVMCVCVCGWLYREEDLLDLAPFLAENSRLGEYGWIVYPWSV